MKRKTLLLLVALMTVGGVFAQLTEDAGGALVSLLPEGVKIAVETAQKQTKRKNLVVVGEKSKGYKAFFAASDATHGEELWVTDGTVAGTRIVKDINPGSSGSDVNWMARFNDKVVFAANDGMNGMEVWISDGTTAGTYMIKQIHEWGDGSNPNGFTQVNETQFVFRARNVDSENYNATAEQYWLWVSDGTEEGTELIAECATLWPGQDNGTYHYHWMRVGRKVFFKADNKDRTVGGELWITDGTAQGTRLVKDINLEPQNGETPEDGKTRDSAIDQMVNFYNEKLFFKAWTPEYGNEPWASDGTEDGTYLIADTNPLKAANGNGVGGNMTEVAQFPYKGKVYGRGWVSTSDTKSEQGTIQLGATNLEKDNFKILEVNVSPASSGADGRINGWPDPGVEFDGVYMFCGQSGTNPELEYNKGGELHYTDGETVFLQSDLGTGATQHNWVKELTVSGGSLYWWCDVGQATGRRQKLFRIDNKDEFPKMITDFDPNGDLITTLRNMGGNLIFARTNSDLTVNGLYCYSYRKEGFDPEKDMGIMDIEYRTRAEITGIQPIDSKQAKLLIYPNPTNDIFSFNVEGKVLNVKIFDMTGRLVKTEIMPKSNSVNVSSLPKGIYNVLITGAERNYRSSLIVK